MSICTLEILIALTIFSLLVSFQCQLDSALLEEVAAFAYGFCLKRLDWFADANWCLHLFDLDRAEPRQKNLKFFHAKRVVWTGCDVIWRTIHYRRRNTNGYQLIQMESLDWYITSLLIFCEFPLVLMFSICISSMLSLQWNYDACLRRSKSQAVLLLFERFKIQHQYSLQIHSKFTRWCLKCVAMNIEDRPLAWAPVPKQNSALWISVHKHNRDTSTVCSHRLMLYASSVGDRPRRGSVQLLGLPTREVQGVGLAWFCNWVCRMLNKRLWVCKFNIMNTTVCSLHPWKTNRSEALKSSHGKSLQFMRLTREVDTRRQRSLTISVFESIVTLVSCSGCHASMNLFDGTWCK